MESTADPHQDYMGNIGSAELSIISRLSNIVNHLSDILQSMCAIEKSIAMIKGKV